MSLRTTYNWHVEHKKVPAADQKALIMKKLIGQLSVVDHLVLSEYSENKAN